MYRILLLLLFPFFVRAELDPSLFSDEEPSLFYHVNVITGHLNLSLQDAVVQGAKQLPILRTYSSGGALESSLTPFSALQKGWVVEGGWSLFPHANLLFALYRYQAYVAEPSGTMVTYQEVHDQIKNLHQKVGIYRRGYEQIR